MLSFVRLEDQQLNLGDTNKVIRAEQYRCYKTGVDIKNDALKEKSNIIQSAKQHFEQEKQRGFKEGQEQATKELAEKMLEVSAQYPLYLKNIEQQVVDLVITTVNQVIDGLDDHNRVLGLVRSALKKMNQQKQVILKVAPENLDNINNSLAELLAAHPNIESIEVKADTCFGSNQCRLETPVGVLDANINQQLDILEQVLVQSLTDECQKDSNLSP